MPSSCIFNRLLVALPSELCCLGCWHAVEVLAHGLQPRGLNWRRLDQCIFEDSTECGGLQQSQRVKPLSS